MNQISKNLIHSDHPLTGPLARGDQNTIKKHIQGLENDPFREVYKSFVNVMKKENINSEIEL
jgi:predicted short-subunit dehydrogenase-like oxidoreductase (DUF2520 family)